MSDITFNTTTTKKRRSGGLFKKSSRGLKKSTANSESTRTLEESRSPTPIPPHEHDFDTGYEDIDEMVEQSASEPPNIPVALVSEQPTFTQISPTPTIGSVKRKHETDDINNGFNNNRFKNIDAVEDSDVEYIFVNGPILNQTVHTYEYDNLLQNNIDSLAQWVSHSIRINSIKECFVFTNNHVDSRKLNLKLIIEDMLLYKINKIHLLQFINMTYTFYTKLIDNLYPIATVAINVNYTINVSDLAQLCTYFINLCVFEFFKPFFQSINLVAGENLLNDTDRQYFESFINEKQTNLTVYYNSKLVNLQAHKYYKYTLNNDANTDRVYFDRPVVQKNIPLELSLYPINVFIVSMYKELRF
nr:hypothetical protein [Buzura suppressaria nucleopolyhedrovirus]